MSRMKYESLFKASIKIHVCVCVCVCVWVYTPYLPFRMGAPPTPCTAGVVTQHRQHQRLDPNETHNSPCVPINQLDLALLVRDSSVCALCVKVGCVCVCVW